eukprot:CAMPEP_0117062842 /NCGR_PEP_ID=MMETSP0472-20121206/43818_1 /TAXON_ID=693140 ORGANISM="Tiarina fusus, Strain LIS" /NCGR_SAMPLE_ID=MMETSP0472 /ASSEMBLY_ACC=CAM_ASM_000603 /LENGTH=331 /DNA_ID=CAMNT_0004782207 /DNA_START=17 /DNA_END=1009 /DNA_ORIENTATION=-
MTHKDEEIQLGFVEEVPDDELHLLLPEYFPSKVGGKPSWIGGTALTTEQTACPLCNQTMPLLMQLYAPLNSVNEQAYHRIIFVLCCKNPICHNKPSPPIRVFRSQFAKDNPFIDIDEDSDSDHENFVEPPADQFSFLEGTCEICGWQAMKHCAKCKQLRYCNREHQVGDWKNGHNSECEKIITQATGQLQKTLIPDIPEAPIQQKRRNYRRIKRDRRFTNQLLFKEFEIVTEPEDKKISDNIEKLQFRADVEGGRLLGAGNDPDEDDDDNPDENEIRKRTEEQMKIFAKYAEKTHDSLSTDGFEEEEWAEKSTTDTTFMLFQQIISSSPDQ